MDFARALDSTIMRHTHGEQWAAIVGAYPGGASVTVRRMEDDDGRHLNIPFSVTVTHPHTTEPAVTCDGLSKVTALLRRSGLPVADAEWKVQA